MDYFALGRTGLRVSRLALGAMTFGGNGRKNILRAVEGSLKRLGTDYIDL